MASGVKTMAKVVKVAPAGSGKMTSATMNSTSSGVKATSNPSVPKVSTPLPRPAPVRNSWWRQVFKSPPLNIYGYAVSTWAVKKCSSARSIFNTVLLLFLNIFVQVHCSQCGSLLAMFTRVQPTYPSSFPTLLSR